MNAPNENATSSAWMRRSADSRPTDAFRSRTARSRRQVVEEDRVEDDPADRQEPVGRADRRRRRRGSCRHSVGENRNRKGRGKAEQAARCAATSKIASAASRMTMGSAAASVLSHAEPSGS
jgi:hypothetical protein